jgi:hypothetical protein
MFSTSESFGKYLYLRIPQHSLWREANSVLLAGMTCSSLSQEREKLDQAYITNVDKIGSPPKLVQRCYDSPE